MINKIHFVYSVPSYKRKTLLEQAFHNFRTRLFLKGFNVSLVGNRSPKSNIMDLWPIQSPFENTKNIYQALSKHAPTKLYHLTEKKLIKFKSRDVFLGHPYFPFTGSEIGITENAIKSKNKPKNLALITPLHCNTTLQTEHLNGTYLNHVDKLVKKVDVVFGIMGEYWWNEWDESPYAHWKSKMVRLDMAVDTKHYPFLKTGFNERGKRKFIYIGNNNPNKGISFLEKLADGIDHNNFGWIGAGDEIKGIKRIATNMKLTPSYMENIANDYDFFISTSVADANPTTVLESMAWGFPVVCTPQSGYYETDYRINIYSDELKRSISILNNLNNMPESKLIKMSEKARKIVESEYTWEKFTNSIISNLNL